METIIKVKKLIIAKCSELQALQFGCFVHVQKGKSYKLMRFLLEREIEGKTCFQLMAEDGDVMWIAKKDFYAGVKKGQLLVLGRPILLSHVLRFLRSRTAPAHWDLKIDQLEGQDLIVFQNILNAEK